MKVYTSWDNFLKTFSTNSGYEDKVPFKISGAHHIDTEFNEQGITRFQGVIKYGAVLRKLILLSTRVQVFESTVIIDNLGSLSDGRSTAYVCYTIWFEKPYSE